eukprot:1016972-Prorocentrum_minimum.AAC.1
MARIGWALWSFSSKNVKVWAAASVSDAVDSEKLQLDQTHRAAMEGESGGWGNSATIFGTMCPPKSTETGGSGGG